MKLNTFVTISFVNSSLEHENSWVKMFKFKHKFSQTIFKSQKKMLEKTWAWKCLNWLVFFLFKNYELWILNFLDISKINNAISVFKLVNACLPIYHIKVNLRYKWKKFQFSNKCWRKKHTIFFVNVLLHNNTLSLKTSIIQLFIFSKI